MSGNQGAETTEFGRSVETTLLLTGNRKKAQRILTENKKYDLLTGLKIIADQEGFDVEAMLGIGGMGAVAKARDRELNREVALKFVTNRNDPKLVRALKREAERTGGISHENVVRVYSLHTVGEVTFFSMEYVEGENLHDRLLRDPRPKETEIIRIMLEASRGIKAAHDLGIIHRDIKPRNIMISHKGVVKVADLGIAATQDELIESENQIAGTIGYMSPEQARGESVSFQADLFSLSATLYFAITGKPLINQSEIMLRQNQTGEFKVLLEKQHPSLIAFLKKGLNFSPAKRHLNIDVFLQELEKLLIDISNKPQKKSRLRLSPTTRSFALAVVIFLAGAAAAAISMNQYMQGVMVSRAEITRQLETIAQTRLQWVERQLETRPNDAPLSIIHNDLTRGLQEQIPSRLIRGITEAEEIMRSSVVNAQPE